MNTKTILVALAATAAATAFAAPVSAPGSRGGIQNLHVPATAEKIRPIYSAATSRNHVLIVDVADAIPASMWGVCVGFAAERVQINIATNSIAASIRKDLYANAGAVQKRFGDKATVAVFIENDPAAPGLISVPGEWCIINVAGLDKGTKDAQILRDRYAKVILRGLGAASGAGASLERNCAMYFDAGTVEGLDKAGLAITPMTYFPMLELLRTRGGAGIVRYGELKADDED